MEKITEKLAKFIVKTKYDDLTKDVIDKAKSIILDAIGCALGSYVVDRTRFAISFAKELGGNFQATIIGDQRTSYTLAAFANGELINALDYDCIGPIVPHVTPYVTPSCLSLGEKACVSGKELITAVVLAHEIGGRIGGSLAQLKVLKKEPPYYEDSPRFSYSYVVFGGVAGACKLLDLDVEKTLNALGIAGASTPVPAGAKWENISGPAIMVKYNAWSGWVAQLATTASLFAEKGFTGDKTILDGEQGFWKIVGSPFFRDDVLLEGLGKVWHTSEVEFKPYPCCRCNHAGIEGIVKIIKEQKIRPYEIEEILIKADPHLQTPNRMGMEAKSFADTQFFNRYLFALAVYHGRNPSPSWQLPLIFNNPEIKKMAGKVKIDHHPKTKELIISKVKTGKPPLFWDTIVEIKARGKIFKTEILAPKGTPTNPMSHEELLEKFINNASYSLLPSKKIEKIIQIIEELEQLDNIGKLTKLLVI